MGFDLMSGQGGAPRCAYCDAAFAKETETRYAKDYPDVQSCADIEAITNMPVTSVRYSYGAEWGDHGNYNPDPATRTIFNWNVWDGESYVWGYGLFCKLTCAESFAQSAYRAGYRITRRQA